jgi:uncharacterized membrane protein YecN with MAPEG domain
MIPRIVPAYAALLALLFIYLSVRVMRARQMAGVAIGTGGNPRLERRIRVHANFAEYVPLALVLLVLLEMRGNAAWYLHVLCLALLAGRAAHAYGVSQEPDDMRMRGSGVVLTVAVLVAASLTLLIGVL